MVSHGGLEITMDGKQGAKLLRDIDADLVITLHFEGGIISRKVKTRNAPISRRTDS